MHDFTQVLHYLGPGAIAAYLVVSFAMGCCPVLFGVTGSAFLGVMAVVMGTLLGNQVIDALIWNPYFRSDSAPLRAFSSTLLPTLWAAIVLIALPLMLGAVITTVIKRIYSGKTRHMPPRALSTNSG